MDIQPAISSWILEFLLKQPLEDSTLRSLVCILPLPNDNLNLKKSFLLRKLESEILRNSAVSETTLGYLEQLAAIEFEQGSEEVSDAMKRAYWQVAVECSVGYLKTDVWEKSKSEFSELLSNIWRVRVGRMENMKQGLGSEELFSWRDKMEKAVSKKSTRKRLVEKSKLFNAVEALKVYLKEERERMGPSFLELVADVLKDEETRKEVLGLGDANGIVSKDSILHSAEGDMAVKGNQREVQKDASVRQSSGTCRGAEIADSECLAIQPLLSEYNLPPTPEVNRVQQALESSRLDLKADVKDPLPDALLCAVEVKANRRTSQEAIHENQHNSIPAANGAGINQSNGENQSDRPRPSIMERNNTAHTYEWDDSIENSSDESANRGRRAKLPSPKRRLISPLKKYENKQVIKRRRVGKWSEIEEKALREGVEKFGHGSWKSILSAYSDKFQAGRTDVDLKDKWRNMSRY